MASAPSPITSPPSVPGQPYNSTSDATVCGWVSVDRNSGPANASGQASGDFESGDGWTQT
jgi:hypothetical protein